MRSRQTEATRRTQAPSQRRRCRSFQGCEPKLSPEQLYARIAQRAYELYEAGSQQHGNELEDWFVAEREILQETC